MSEAKWKMEVSYPTFIRTYPKPEMKGGGINIVSADRKINFLTTFLDDERGNVEAAARQVLKALNKKG